MGKTTCWWLRSCLLLGSLSGLMPLPAPAARADAEEFTAPMQAATTIAPSRAPSPAGRVRMVKNETTGEMALHAKTAQDAIAAAISQRTAGCQPISFGRNGLGWVATGMASYAVADPPDAVQQAKREARFKAFTEARIRLHSNLRALAPEAQQRITARLEQSDAMRLALVNLAANDQERNEQALGILARGFVAYAVEEDVAGQTIRVHLVATPKTATRLTRPTASAMETTALREGFKQTQAEIESGLIPPVGNRLIVVNATGELALVGYAVTVVSGHPDPVAQEQLRAAAGKMAATRATEALVGLAAGDDAGWQSELSEAGRNAIRAAASGYQEAEPSANRFGQIRDLLMTTVKDDPGLHALRENRLPSAVMIKRFGGEEAVAVMMSYTPPVRKREISPPAQSSDPTNTPLPEPPAPPASAPLTPPTEPAPMEER